MCDSAMHVFNLASKTPQFKENKMYCCIKARHIAPKLKQHIPAVVSASLRKFREQKITDISIKTASAQFKIQT
jgi:hypothetical protein